MTVIQLFAVKRNSALWKQIYFYFYFYLLFVYFIFI